MDFFALQDKAKKQTKVLVALFLLAVLAIVVTTNLVFFIVAKTQTSVSMSLSQWLSEPYWLIISGAVIAIILVASLWRSWQLNSSPDAIAKMVNATPVSLSSKDPQQRVLINVIEEMSIASGMPIPKIYIMQQESGINAFVAGLEPSKVTLVVTQGLLDTLNRQELQGVIAHEYSHVFHGDMRINVRLIGILAGILVIGQLGGLLLRSGGTSRRRSSFSSSSSGNKSSGNAGAVIAIGLGLFAIGYIGLFFGRLIKAAISRQREFLADASAVQYTRDKDGIAGALYKISLHQNHSLLNASKAEEMSHMCFGESIKQSFGSLLATHPPIAERIKAIHPGFNYKVKFPEKNKSANSQSAKQPPDQTSANITGEEFSQFTDGNQAFSQIDDALGAQFSAEGSKSPVTQSTMQPASINSQSILTSIGDVSAQQMDNAHQLFASIPQPLIDLAHNQTASDHCYALIIALLKANQKNQVSEEFEHPYSLKASAFENLVSELSCLSFQQQHCLLDISLASVQQQPEYNNKTFVANLARIVAGDHQISQTEFMIYASAVKRALPKNQKTKSVSRFNLIGSEISLFFNLLFVQSEIDAVSQQDQFERQMKLFGISNAKFNAHTASITQLSQALNKIAQLNPLLKKDFIQACIDVVENDQKITQDEYELLRVLGEYLESPLPISPSH